MSIKKYTNGSWTPASRKYGTETDTITTLPVTIIGDGTPITSYTIKGNMEQSGTPTPSSPIYPSECGEKTENLFDIESWLISIGVDFSKEGNVYTFSATQPMYSTPFYFSDVDIPVSISGIITDITAYNTRINLLRTDGTIAKSSAIASITGVKKSENIVCAGLQFDWSRAGTMRIDSLMLNTGSTALPYEPYGYKLPLTLGSTTTDIYLGEVQSTRRIKKLVLTGEEGWRRTANEKCYYIDLANGCPNDYLKQLTTTSICSHYQSQNNTASGSNEVDAGHFCFYIGGGFELYIGETTISSATDFKSYLQQQYANGTPVTVWYVLANPTTGIVNEPIRKIGDYVDSVSGTNLATSGTAQEFDINTTLKPSEVDMTYHGWHEHDDTKFTT